MSRLVAASDPAAIERAVEALRRGEMIGIPTETVYGLSVLPTEDGLDRLIAAKQRSAEKGIQLLVDSLAQVEEMAVLTPSARMLAELFWPGGLTIVLRRRDDVAVPEALGGGRPTLGIRLPDHEVPRAIARELGPIAASSANISGEPPATEATSIDANFGDEITLILDDGPVRGGTSSTVVDCSDPSAEPAVLREGAIAADAITRALR
jgi:L-threonylcarbamoyladenylate synthase